MREVEIKVLDIDRADIEKKIIALGAKKSFDGEIRAIYYDSSDHFVRKTGGTFRLRKEGATAVLTYKDDVADPDAKVREEKEVIVSDFDVMQGILASAGFSVWLEMRKNRTTYELGGLHLEFDRYLDAYDYIPEFLEIEGTDVGEVYRCAEMLGFRKEDCRPWDAVQVARHYSGQAHND
jgi:predicted adenylyl cyclase CyaB